MKKPGLKKMLLSVLCCLGCLNLLGQGIQIGGVVLDESSVPVLGATVVVKGTAVGTSTAAEGRFSLTVNSADDILVVNFLGFTSQEVRVGNVRDFRIVLKEDFTQLEEIVVTGYGTARKADLTGASSVVSAKVLNERQPINVYQALQGEVPGLMISNSSGAPGEQGTMVIRGNTTMGSGVTPLYIVDGFIVEDISSINPTDIESMVVNKDAASAAIYGSRSAAGVIIITTKKGQMGNAKVSVKYNHSFQRLSHKLDQATAAERYIFEQRMGYNLGLYKTNNDPYHPNQMADNDYQDLITRTANTDQLDLGVAGATEKVNYRTSLGLLNQQGIIINSYLKRFTLRTNVTYNATSKLRLETLFSVAYQNTNKINTGAVISQALRRPPQMALYFPDGSYIYNNGGQFNPIADAYERKNKEQRYDINLAQSLVYTILPGLEWRGSIQGNLKVTRLDNLRPGNLVADGVTTGYNEAILDRKLLGETYLTWNGDFGDHRIGAMAGASVEDWLNEEFPFHGSQYISNEVESSNMQEIRDLGKTVTTFSAHSMASFFGRASYNFRDKYLFNATLRYDGSSRFIEKQWGFFPSVSAAWRLSAENFMGWAKPVLHDAKIRASWGATGNERVGNYDTRNTYRTGSYFNGGISIIQDPRIANTELGWETTKQANIGLDLTLLDGRFSAVVDYYVKNTTDLLSLELMPLESGVTDMRVNFGELQNKGFEVTLSGYPVRNENFRWQTSVNFARNNNKVMKINGGASYIENGRYWIEEGAPLGQWYGYRNLGVYAYDESNAYAKNSDGSFGDRLTPVYQTDPNNYNNLIYGTNGKPQFLHYVDKNGNKYDGDVGRMQTGGQVAKGGDLVWEDTNRDGTIGDADRQILGNSIPKWYGGWSNYIDYKDFSLSFTFYGSFGNKIYNQQRRDLMQYSSTNVTPFSRDIYTIWKYQGQQTDNYSGVRANNGTNNAREVSSFFLEDGDYIKLQNFRFSYRFSGYKALANTPLDGAVVYFYGNNVMTWTDYRGYDPSSISDTNPLRGGVDSGRYPTVREFGFGIQLNF